MICKGAVRAGAAAVALAAALTLAAGAGAAAPAHVYGAGTAMNGGLEPSSWSFDATGVGPDASGTMRYQYRNTVVTAHVVCVAASTTSASVVGVIDSGSPNPYMTFDLTTGEMFTAWFGGAAAAHCLPQPSLALFPLLSGSVAIEGGDATPPALAPTLAGTLGDNGWYTSDVQLGWSVAEPDSYVAWQQGCGETDVTTDGVSALTCAAASPGGRSAQTVTVRRDATPPVVSWSGAAATYTVADTVDVRCSATDATSGVASSSCADLDGPAWQFGVGAVTRSATATDLAGNVGSGSVSFTVVVTPASLETLIGRLVGNAGVASSLAAKVESIAAAPNAHAKAGELRAFDNAVAAQTGKAIDASDAALLERLAAAL